MYKLSPMHQNDSEQIVPNRLETGKLLKSTPTGFKRSLGSYHTNALENINMTMSCKWPFRDINISSGTSSGKNQISKEKADQGWLQICHKPSRRAL